MARLGDVFSVIRNGASIKQTDGAGGLPITRIETISNREVDRNKLGYAGIKGADKYRGYILQDGDILMSHINSEKHLGKVALYKKQGNERIIHGMNLLMLRANEALAYPPFAAYYFETNMFLNQIQRITKKSVNQASFTVTALKEIEMPLPPLEEQRRIAATLDKVSGLIAKRRAQLDKLDLLVKAQFVEMFGDPVTNPYGYPVHQLSDYIEFLTSGSRGWAQYFSDEGEYFITIKNVKNCRITLNDVQHIVPPDNAEAKRTKVQEGDLLISITADLGRTGVVTKEIADHGAYINQHLTCIRLNQKEVLPLYVAYYMESDAGKGQFQAKNQSAVKAGLNFNSINTLRLMVPPKEQQGSFIDFVERTGKSKLTIQRSLDKLEILKKALMQQYFR